MITIITDYDDEMRLNPQLPYGKEMNIAPRFQWHVEAYRQEHEGTLFCECSVCGLKFITKKPLRDCPFEREHKDLIGLDMNRIAERFV